MAEAQNSNTEVPPHAQLVQMAMAHWVSRIVHLAAKLGLADYLADGPKSAEELAAPTATLAPSLYRLMRTLSSLGMVTEVGDGAVFGLTPLGEALRTGAPGSARASVLTIASDWSVPRMSWGELLYSLQTGKTGFEKHVGKNRSSSIWRRTPSEASLLQRDDGGLPRRRARRRSRRPTTSRGSGRSSTSAARRATCLTAISARHRGPRGVLFDLPHVVRDAPALLESRGMAERVSIESGSFFEACPSGGDAYMLSHIIHDWERGAVPQTILDTAAEP